MNMYSDHSHFVLPYRVSSHAFVAENVWCYARLLGASIAKKILKQRYGVCLPTYPVFFLSLVRYVRT